MSSTQPKMAAGRLYRLRQGGLRVCYRRTIANLSPRSSVILVMGGNSLTVGSLRDKIS